MGTSELAGDGGAGLAAVDRHVGVVAARLQRHDTLPVVLDIIIISETNQENCTRSSVYEHKNLDRNFFKIWKISDLMPILKRF